MLKWSDEDFDACLSRIMAYYFVQSFRHEMVGVPGSDIVSTTAFDDLDDSWGLKLLHGIGLLGLDDSPNMGRVFHLHTLYD
jgi:hypothetical protein